MPLDSALAASDAFRAALLTRERQAATRLARAYGAAYQRLLVQVEALTVELERLAEKGELSPVKVGRLARLKSLQKQIEAEVSRYAVYASEEIGQGARAALAQAQRDAKALTQAALPGLAPLDAAIMGQWQQLRPEAVESLLGFLADDSPLMAGMREQLGPAVAERVGEKLVEGLALGMNPRKVAEVVRKELGDVLTDSLRLARTVQVQAYRDSTHAAYLANSDIIKGWTRRSARLPNTCMGCLVEDGTFHILDERLVDHWNGRCTQIPVTKTYREMGLDVAEPKDVLEHPTGEAWFNSLSESQQRAQMGPMYFEAWQAGKFKFSDLSQDNDDAVWGSFKVQTPLKDLVPKERKAA